MFALMFSSLAPAYHTAGLDWLYCHGGLMALGLSVFGSVFATQSQIYDAKDNGLLPVHAHPTPDHSLEPGASPMVPERGLFSSGSGTCWGSLWYYGWIHPIRVGLPLCAVLPGGHFFCPRLCACWAGCSTCSLNRINKSLASAVYMVSSWDLLLSLQPGREYFERHGRRAPPWPAHCKAGPGLYAMGQACTGSLRSGSLPGHLHSRIRPGLLVLLTPSWALQPCSTPGSGKRWTAALKQFHRLASLMFQEHSGVLSCGFTSPTWV